MACLPQLGSVPAAYAVVAGDCDWPLPSAVGLSNNDVIALRPLCNVSSVTSLTFLTVRAFCVALDGNPALCHVVCQCVCQVSVTLIYLDGIYKLPRILLHESLAKYLNLSASQAYAI